MAESTANITEPGFLAHCGRWIGTHFRGMKGVERLLRAMHHPDRRQSQFYRTIANAYPEGPKYHLESRWWTEWLTYFYGSLDKNIHQWIVKNARPDWVAFDIGMNFGYFACLLGSRAKDVHGFEPVKWLAGRARANVELNGFKNVTINEIALSDHIGTAELHLPTPGDANWGTSSLVHRSSSPTDVVQVPLDTLDNYCASRQITRLDFMKMDVEGAEHLVLRGAPNTLKHLRPTIIFEHNADSAADAYAILKAQGYELYDLQQRPLPLEQAPLHDVLALPQG